MASELELKSSIDSFIQREQAYKESVLRNNFSNVASTAPEQFAKDIALSKATMIPIQALHSDPEEAARHRALVGTDFTGLVTDAPKTADFLLNPVNAGIARNDVGNLSSMEKGITSLEKNDSIVGDLMTALHIGTTVDIPQTVLGLATVIHQTMPLTRVAEWALPQFFTDMRTKSTQAVRDILEKNRAELETQYTPASVASNKKNFFGDEVTWKNVFAEGIGGAIPKLLELRKAGGLFGEAWTDPRKLALSATESLPGTVATMGPVSLLAKKAALTAGSAIYASAIQGGASEGTAVALATKGATVAAERTAMIAGGIAEGLQGAGQQYEQTRGQIMSMPLDTLKASPEYQAAYNALPQDMPESEKELRAQAQVADSGATVSFAVAFAFDSVFGALGDRYLGTAVAGGKGGRLRSVGRGISQEAPTEFVQSGGEQFGTNLGVQQYADPNQPLTQNVGEQATLGGLSGGLMGAAMGGAFYRRVQTNAGKTLAETAQAQNNANTMSSLFSTAAESLKHAPETLKEFFQSVAPDQTVTIDPTILKTTLESAGLDVKDVLPSAAAQYERGPMPGVGIELPVGELLQGLSGTGVEQTIVDNLRVTPDSPTLAETKAAGDKANAYFQEEAGRVLEEQAKNEQFQAETKQVQQFISDQLDQLNGRFGPQVKNSYSKLISDFFAVTSNRLGITPLQMMNGWQDATGQQHRGYKLNVLGPQGAPLNKANILYYRQLANKVLGIEHGSTDAGTVIHEHTTAALANELAKALGVPAQNRVEIALAALVHDIGKGTLPEGLLTADRALTPEERTQMQTHPEAGASALLQAGVPQKIAEIVRDHHREVGGGYPTTSDYLSFSAQVLHVADVATSVGSQDAGHQYIHDASLEKARAVLSAEGYNKEVVAAFNKLADEHRLPAAFYQKGGTLHQGMPVATEATFTRDGIRDVLGSSQWAIMTAENPMGLRASEEANAKANADLSARLDQLGLAHFQIRGKYGNIGNPYVILGVTPEQSLALGKEFNQESVLTRQGLVYQDGSVTPATGVTVHATEPSDFYSTLPDGSHFTINLNFAAPRTKLDMGIDSNELGQSNSLVPYTPTADKIASFNPETLDMRLLANANLSSFLHETGHFFLTVYSDLAASGTAPQAIVDDMNTLLKWFGIPDAATWNAMPFDQKKPHHEKFAESFEQYLFSNKAPSLELESMFKRFASFLRRVYGSVKDFVATHTGATLTPDVSAVMDRMLATDEAIQVANETRNYSALFQNAVEAGMDEQHFAEYTALTREQQDDAEAMLRTRSLRDMKWMRNSYDRTIKELQADARSKRGEVRAEVAKEVAASPVYRAMRFLRSGEIIDAEGNVVQQEIHKLQISDVQAMYPKEAAPVWQTLGYGNTGMLATEGLSPDTVASMLGFRSGEDMIAQLVSAPKMNEEIETQTDLRMLDQYGDLNSPEALAKAADEAIHNDAHSRLLATELAALNNKIGAPRVLLKAAKEFARQRIATKTMKTLKPMQYAAAEVRANKAAQEALRKGQRDEAAAYKRTALINQVSAKEAYKTEKELRGIFNRLHAIASYKEDSAAVKSRDAELVATTRAILSEFDIGSKGKRAQEYLEVVKRLDPELAASLTDVIIGLSNTAKNWQKLSVADARELAGEIEGLWFLAKRAHQIEIDGKLMSLQDAQNELYARIDQLGIPTVIPGENSAVTESEKRHMKFDRFIGTLTRVENWVDAKDGGNTGPFRKFMWSPISEAATKYRADKARYLRAYKELLRTIEPTLTRQLIEAPELGYTFGAGEGGMGKAELLHALLHTGNESNLRKLLLGRHWATENEDGSLNTTKWDTFIARMQDRGTLTKTDYDFAQGVWNLMESMKPAAQKAHHEVFGKYFAEVTAKEFNTPFGMYAGGYVPAITDPLVVRDADLRALAEAEQNNMSYAFPAPARGFTKSRVESYTRPLKLDLRSLSQHIDKALLFSHLAQPVNDVRRLMRGKTVSQALHRQDPQAFNTMIVPWLNRAAHQIVETQTPGKEGLGRFWTTVRKNAGMSAMFGNVANALQQVMTSPFTAMVKVRPTMLVDAFAKYAMSPREFTAYVTGKSQYMGTRMENEAMSMTEDINDILLNPSTYQNTKNWLVKHSYFLQTAADNIMSGPVWLAAYNQSIEGKMSETEAVRFADSVVRETQGSWAPEDIASFESGTPFYRMFVQFAGYFNMIANLLGNEYVQITRDMGLRKGMGRGLYVFMVGYFLPAVFGELAIQLMHGGPPDDDGDGEYLDDWLMDLFVLAPARYGTAMIPGFGPVANAGLNMLNNQPYDDRISTSPAISMVESSLRAPQSVYRAVMGESKPSRAVKDVATLISMTTGVPASALARPFSYGADVAAGRVEPTGPVDVTRGIATGFASPESKH